MLGKKFHMTGAKVILIAVFVVAIGIGVTFAAVVAGLPTETKTNVFTVGNVDITLTEEQWDLMYQEHPVLHPGIVLQKDPKVTNTGVSDSYLFLEVWVPQYECRTVAPGSATIDALEVRQLFSYTTNPGWTFIEEYQSDDGAFMIKVYGYNDITSSGFITGTLFDTVTFLEVVEGDIPMNTVIDMPVNAVAVQSDYLPISETPLLQKLTDAYNLYKQAAAE